MLQLSPVKIAKESPIKVNFISNKTERKPNYCLYCGLNKSNNIRQHLLSKHSSEKEMKVASESSKEEKSKIWSSIVRRGNEKHNQTVIDTKAGALLPAKRSRVKKRPALIKCEICSLMFARNHFFTRHLPLCKKKNAEAIALALKEASAASAQTELTGTLVDVRQLNIAAKSLRELKGSYGTTARKILNGMRDKEKKIEEFLCLDDRTVRQMVKDFSLDHESGNNKLQILRKQVRLLHGLYSAFKNHPEISSSSDFKLQDIVRRKVWQGDNEERVELNVDRIVSVILDLCGGTEESNRFERPNDVMSLTSMVRKIAVTVKFTMGYSQAETEFWNVESTHMVDYLSSRRYRGFTTNRAGLQKRLEEKLQKIHIEPEDFVLYCDFLENNCTILYEKLMRTDQTGTELKKAYQALAKHHSLLFCAFNAKRSSEPNYITLTDYAAIDNFSDGTNNLLKTPIQRELAGRFLIISHIGKGTQKVMSLIKQSWNKYLLALTDPEIRMAASIPLDCKYMYGSLSKENPIDPRYIQEKVAVQCGAKHPEHLRSRYIRTTFASTIGKMNITYPAKKMLCLLMGHTMGVHDKFYELPTGLGFSLLMGRALEIFSAGKVDDFQGKSLEEVADIRDPIMAPPNPADE